MSRDVSVRLGLIKLVGEVNRELFEGLGQVTTEYEIQIKDDIKPYSINVPRPVPIHHQPEVKKRTR